MLLSSYVNSFKNLKILVIGDIMLDTFTYGEVSRISPEAPVPVFNLKKSSDMLGGAGNVVANLASLGINTSFIGVVGNDESGKKIANLLKNINVTFHLIKLKNFPSIVKKRIIAGNTHLIRIDTEEKWTTPQEILPRIKNIVKKAVANSDIVLLSDYAKGTLTKDTAQLLIKECLKQNKKIFIDPKGNDYSKYFGAFLVKPNLKEFMEASGMQIQKTDKDLEQKILKGAKYIFDKYQIKNLLITLSELGMAYISAEHPDIIRRIPTEAKEVYDVSGAGDTCLATLAASFGVGASPIEAMKLANKAAGIVVGKVGTACVSAKELENSLSNSRIYSVPKTKILSIDNVVALANIFNKEEKKVILVKGIFDSFELYTLSQLKKAKSNNDILIVGIYSDEFLKNTKTHSFQDEKTRTVIVCSLEIVDYVVLLSNSSEESMILDLFDNYFEMSNA